MATSMPVGRPSGAFAPQRRALKGVNGALLSRAGMLSAGAASLRSGPVVPHDGSVGGLIATYIVYAIPAGTAGLRSCPSVSSSVWTLSGKPIGYNLCGIGVSNWAIGIGQRSPDRLLLLRRGVGAGALCFQEHRPDGEAGGDPASLERDHEHGDQRAAFVKSNRHDNAVERRAVVQPRRASTLSYPIVGVRVPTYLRPTKDRYLAPDLRWLVVVLMASWRS
jgi:hypothetical protein